jgi:hypothetical protein
MGEWNGTATTYPDLGPVAVPFCEAISIFVRKLSRDASAERFLSLNAPKRTKTKGLRAPALSHPDPIFLKASIAADKLGPHP